MLSASLTLWRAANLDGVRAAGPGSVLANQRRLLGARQLRRLPHELACDGAADRFLDLGISRGASTNRTEPVCGSPGDESLGELIDLEACPIRPGILPEVDGLEAGLDVRHIGGIADPVREHLLGERASSIIDAIEGRMAVGPEPAKDPPGFLPLQDEDSLTHLKDLR